MKYCFIGRNYTYWGEPIGGISQYDGMSSIALKDCYMIYDTGVWSDPEWKIAEYLGNWSVRKDALESWGVIDKRLPAGATLPATQEKTIAAVQSQSQYDGSSLADGEGRLLFNNKENN